jgi:hypothetical protein
MRLCSGGVLQSSPTSGYRSGAAVHCVCRSCHRDASLRHECRVAGAGWIVVDLDATVITSASRKEGVAPTFKGTLGFHPLGGWLADTGENLAMELRAGNAGANTVDDVPSAGRSRRCHRPDGCLPRRAVPASTPGAPGTTWTGSCPIWQSCSPTAVGLQPAGGGGLRCPPNRSKIKETRASCWTEQTKLK